MKIKNIVLLMLSVFTIIGLVGCNSQAKIDEADAERITIIEEKVDALFNKDKTDIVDFAKEQVEEIDGLLEEEEGNEFSEENALRIGSVVLYISKAMQMQEFEGRVEVLFDDEGVLVKDASIEGLDEEVEEYKEETVFYDRLVERLSDAESQMVTVNKVTDYVESLFENSEVKKDVTRKQEKEATKLIGELGNKEIKEELLARLVEVDASLTVKEEEIALAKKEEEQKQEEQRKQEEAKKQQVAQESNENKASSGTSSNSGNSGNKGTTNSNGSGSKKQTASSNETSKKSTETKSVSKNQGSSNTKPKNNTSTSVKPKEDKGNGGQVSGQDIADMFNDADCKHTGSGEIDKGGNTWNSYNCN